MRELANQWVGRLGEQQAFYAFALFTLLCVVGAAVGENYVLLAAPFVVLLGLATVADLRAIYGWLLFSIPLSIEYSFGITLATDLPGEPLLILLTLAAVCPLAGQSGKMVDAQLFVSSLHADGGAALGMDHCNHLLFVVAVGVGQGADGKALVFGGIFFAHLYFYPTPALCSAVVLVALCAAVGCSYSNLGAPRAKRLRLFKCQPRYVAFVSQPRCLCRGINFVFSHFMGGTRLVSRRFVSAAVHWVWYFHLSARHYFCLHPLGLSFFIGVARGNAGVSLAANALAVGGGP